MASVSVCLSSGLVVLAIGSGSLVGSSRKVAACSQEALEVVRVISSSEPPVTRSIVPSSLADIASLAGGYDVVLIGEVHDDPTAHELELGILQECFQRMRASRSLHLSLEMFETDVQRVIDEYTRGIISERDMMVDGRAWMNYPSDYRKMVEFAKEHGIPVIAANAPRRYISVVGNRGMSSLDQLSSSSRSFLPPLPVPPASGPYQLKFTQQMQLMQQEVAAEGKRNSEGKSSSTSSLSRQDKGAQGQAAGEEGAACPYIGWSAERSRFMLEAQNLWDATMAHSIAQILNGGGDLSGGGGGGGGGGEKLTRGGVKDGKAPLVIHVTGKFHCEERLGIPEHLHRYAPHAKVMVVVCAGEDELSFMNEAMVSQLGDFVVISRNKERSFEGKHPV